MKALVEHLGLTYREFLMKSTGGKTTPNSIKVRTVTSQIEVTPIPVPLTVKNKSSTFAMNAGGIDSSVKYQRGILDTGVTRVVYHRATELTQGYDIVVGNKVIESAAFEKIWAQLRHDAFNKLTGEISIQVTAGEIPLAATKDRLDWSSEFANALVKRIRKLDDRPLYLLRSFTPTHYTPKKKKLVWIGSEDDLTNLLKDSIDKTAKGVTTREHSAWDKSLTGIEPGVAADLTYEEPGKFVVIEAKQNYADVSDVYQLRLYWDGFCDSNSWSKKPTGPHPTSAVLLASSFKPGTKWLAGYISKLSCACGKQYGIQCSGWGALGLPPKVPGGVANDTKVTAALKRWLS